MNEDARTKSAFSTVEACRSIFKLDNRQLSKIAQNVVAFDACGKITHGTFQWRRNRSGRSGGRRTNIFTKKEKKKKKRLSHWMIVCHFLRLVEWDSLVMEDPVLS